MNNLSILIIDDEEEQVKNLERALRKDYSEGVSFFTAFEEKDILKKIEYCYYDIAIVDLRMSSYTINGFEVIRRIKEISPYAKVIIVSAYSDEFKTEINTALELGSIIGFVGKEDFNSFKNAIKDLIDKYVIENNLNSDVVYNSLKSHYANLKNEVNPYKKGQMFEFFTSMLFGQMGFSHIRRDVKDKTPNELDLIIRNDLNDPFFAKFSPYILVECKNYPEEKVDKNVYIIFEKKLSTSNGLSNLGILITTGSFKETVMREAIRDTLGNNKIILLSNADIENLMHSKNKLDIFKEIIDFQVKNT